MASPALRALTEAGVEHRVIRHGRVTSLSEAAAARGVPFADVVRTIVIRRGEGDFLLVLVPGDRVISWPKLRALLGVTGYPCPTPRLRERLPGTSAEPSCRSALPPHGR